MEDVQVTIPAEELGRILEFSLSEATLLDLVMAIKYGCNKTEQEATKAAENDSLLMVLTELTEKIELLTRRVEDLEGLADDVEKLRHSAHEINRHLIIMCRHGNSGSIGIDTFLLP